MHFVLLVFSEEEVDHPNQQQQPPPAVASVSASLGAKDTVATGIRSTNIYKAHNTQTIYNEFPPPLPVVLPIYK